MQLHTSFDSSPKPEEANLTKMSDFSSSSTGEQCDSNANSSTTCFQSPKTIKSTANPLRRSLVIQLDTERRVHCERMEEMGPSEVPGTRRDVSDDVFLPSDADLIEALDLDGSNHRMPQLRLRPVASCDFDEFCVTCGGGNTAPFQTPRTRQSFLPPPASSMRRQSMSRSSTSHCTCFGLSNPHTTLRNGEASIGPRLSFLHMTSPTPDEQNVFATTLNQVDGNGIRESLQLFLDDDESSTEDSVDDAERNQSAFRPRVMLQPQAINRCHSDPSIYMTPGVYDFSTTVLQSRPPRDVREDKGNPMLERPALHHMSTGSSTVTSPGNQGPILFSHDVVSSATNSDNSHRDTTTSLVSGQQHDDDDDDIDIEVAHATSSVPFLPTMETPEVSRPIRGGITLAPHPSYGDLLIPGIPSPPRIFGSSNTENKQETS